MAKTYMLVGLDCEWRPHPIRDMSNKTATLQLCVDTKCLILQLFYMDYIPQSIKSFLSDPNFAFVGVEVQKDASKLMDEYGLNCPCMADIQAIAMTRFPLRFYRKPGLKDLAYHSVGLVVAKPMHVCKGNWESTFGVIRSSLSYLGFFFTSYAMSWNFQGEKLTMVEV
ncbi:hypothetical protein L1049_004528 [Liquidambar formosana]|uniref:3'-5' exonuclease domain-containing protein n=1 Tax=Liquidambar formosana TaxID=63359 RepID=A0AAP0RPE7_LIQFO